MDAIENELDAERASGEETIHVGPFGDLPVLILSRDPTVLSSNWPASVAKANSVVWNQMQEESKALSTQSIRIIAKRSDHYIQNDRPDLVIQEITTQTTAGTIATAHSVGNLAEMAANLRESVSGFKLPEELIAH